MRESAMGSSGSGKLGLADAKRRGRSADESLARTLAQASVEIDELCAEHGITPELIETRQAIESATAALSDFVDGEHTSDDDTEAGTS